MLRSSWRGNTLMEVSEIDDMYKILGPFTNSVIARVERAPGFSHELVKGYIQTREGQPGCQCFTKSQAHFFSRETRFTNNIDCTPHGSEPQFLVQ